MRKSWGALLGCAGALSTFTPSAMADGFGMQLCKQGDGTPGASADLVVSGDLTVTTECDPGPTNDGVHISAPGGQGGTARVRVTAPGAAKITAASVHHDAVLGNTGTLRLLAVRGGQEEPVSPTPGAGGPDQTNVAGQGEPINLGAPADGLVYEVSCAGSCPALQVRLFSLQLTLDDPDDPVVSGQGTVTGENLDVTVRASDATSGVRELRVLVDGGVVATRSQPCEPRIRPCKDAVEVPVQASVTGLADGVHRLRLEVRDASGRLGTSDSDVVVDRSPPIGTGVPGVVGLPEVGQTLMASPGGWNAQSPTFTYRWERCRDSACVPIAGAEGPSYVVRDEDQEQELRVVEIARDAGGTAAQASSRTAAVSPQVPVLVEALRLAGDEQVGGRIQAAGGVWRNAVALRYQWASCSRRDGTDCVALPGRERPVLDIEREDVGRYLVLTVTATGPRGHVRQASAASGRIPFPPLRNLSEPSIGGTAALGGRLTAETGAWEGESLRFETQWLRCNTTGCEPIDGAISRSYRPMTKDLGATLVVLITARDALGEALPIRSRPTERVRSADGKALPVPRIRTRVRIVSFGNSPFALNVGPRLQVLDVLKGSRVDVICRLCARSRLGRRSKVKTRTVTFRLPGDGVQIPPGGQLVVRVRRKGIIGREVVGTLSLNSVRRVSWSAPRCLAKDASLRRVTCPATKKAKKAPAKKKPAAKRTTTKKAATEKAATP